MMITKLVLPVAGLGVRLRPLTLSTPKNLIPVGGRPLLEYSLDEAAAAGIDEIVLVISPEHSGHYEKYLSLVKDKYPRLKFHLRIQEKPWGHGHAVLQAADVIRNEPFAVRFPDDIIIGGRPVMKTLVQIFEDYAASALLLMRVPEAEVHRYGVVKAEEIQSDPKVYRIYDFIEKPEVEEAPSNLIVIAGYVFTPEVMDELKGLEKNMTRSDDSLLVSDGFIRTLREGKPMYGWEFDGKRLDCGTLQGLEAAEAYLRNR